MSDLNKSYINGKRIYSDSRWCINLNFEKLTLKTGFVVHICSFGELEILTQVLNAYILEYMHSHKTNTKQRQVFIVY